MQIKSGPSGADVRYMHPAVWGALFIARWLWFERFPSYPFVITSGGEGKHKQGSRHYLSQAADVRTKDTSGVWMLTGEERESYRKELSYRVGDEFDVTVSPKYGNVHVELDPKDPVR